MKDYSKMLWDSNKPFTGHIARAFIHADIRPEEIYSYAQTISSSEHYIEIDFWQHFFGADFRYPIPPDYLREISHFDRETRRIFSIIAFALLDETIIERLINSGIKRLKGSVRTDGLRVTIITIIKKAEPIDSFRYINDTEKRVEFDFEKVLTHPLFGKCLMNLLNSRLRYSLNESQQVSFNDLLNACFELKFHEALGLTKTIFKLWLKGITGGMLWDSNEAFTKNIAKVFSTTAVYPVDLFDKTWESYPEQSIETDFWQHYFGIDFHTPAPPEYLFEISNLDRETRRIFSIIAFILLDKPFLERLVDSKINQLRGHIRIDGLNSLINTTMIRQTESNDSFKYFKDEAGEVVEFNFEKVLTIPLFGKCILKLLNSRLRYSLNESQEVPFNDLVKTCNELKFYKALGLTETVFRQWLEGTNISTGEYISETTISNFICIDNATLDFRNPNSEISKEIYLLGENGDGKTLILEALLMTYAKEWIKGSAAEMGNAYKLYDEVKRKGATLKGIDNKNIEYGNNRFSYLPQIFAYGTHRGRISSDTASSFDDFGFLTLFDTNKTLTDPSEWIKGFFSQVALGSMNEQLTQKKLQAIHENVNEMRDELHNIFDIILNKEIKISTDGVSVKYVEHGAELTFDQLSEGYRSTLIFICDLLYRLFDSQPENGEKATERAAGAKAVVLIDEIDAHLHPRWQREIVGKMRKLFPNVQFIMTTHSPFIIQGASPDAVIFRLFRENGKTCVSEPIKRSDLDYMMINTLATSPIFGVESARLNDDDNMDYTSNSYLMERIEKTILEKIRNDKSRNYLSEKEIDEMISETWEQIDSENQ